jgi:hypothetical protein
MNGRLLAPVWIRRLSYVAIALVQFGCTAAMKFGTNPGLSTLVGAVSTNGSSTSGGGAASSGGVASSTSGNEQGGGNVQTTGGSDEGGGSSQPPAPSTSACIRFEDLLDMAHVDPQYIDYNDVILQIDGSPASVNVSGSAAMGWIVKFAQAGQSTQASQITVSEIRNAACTHKITFTVLAADGVTVISSKTYTDTSYNTEFSSAFTVSAPAGSQLQVSIQDESWCAQDEPNPQSMNLASGAAAYKVSSGECSP